MDIRTYRLSGEKKGFVSFWEHRGFAGKAYSKTPEQAEKNAMRQAKRRGLDMTDWNGEAQSPGITRCLTLPPVTI